MDDMLHGMVARMQICDTQEQDKPQTAGAGMHGSLLYEPPVPYSQYLEQRKFSLLSLLFREGAAQIVSGNP